MKGFFTLSAVLAILPTSLAYLQPAPASKIAAIPLSDFDTYSPPIGSGNFAERNPDVAPWNVVENSSPALKIPAAKSTCTLQKPGPRNHAFWLPNVPHEGTSPILSSSSKYKVYRNVKKYGAKGDGQTDDTIAIQNAINDYGRVPGGNGAGGTTGQPAVVYIPPGTYLVTGEIQLYIGTQIVGDAINIPTIKASSTFSHAYVVNGFDPGQQSTTNFYLGIRNINIDTTSVDVDSNVYCLNWAVSQATNLINTNFEMPNYSQHVGITMNGGSGGGGSGTFMGDLSFKGGMIGIQMNNQQYALKNISFNGCNTAIAIQHAFVLSFQQLHFLNCGTAVDMSGSDTTGSMSLIDSSAQYVGIVVNGAASTVLENVLVTDCGPTLLVNGDTKVSGSLEGQTYIYGHVYNSSLGPQVQSTGGYWPYTKRGLLTDVSGDYVIKSQPQYTQYAANAFVSVKDVGAKGDGKTDDTAAINAALAANAGCKITYFPHGIYVVTDTIRVPPNSRIVGEMLSEITASGPNFSDASNPRVMFEVGLPDEVGIAEISDMLFTVADVLPGAILVEVNMAGIHKGDVSFHNVHYRVGGAAGSKTETACQTSGSPCKAAFMMLHLGPTAQTYIENSWLWTADHDLDGRYNQVIGTGRGVYVESTRGTWLLGTASEHHILYAYQFSNAQNVFISMNQVETPYYQPVPQAPTPWTPDATWNDPTFTGCKSTDARCYMQWAMRIIGPGTHTIAVYGSGFWVFFDNYGGCEAGYCQLNAVDLEDLSVGDGVYLYNLNTLNVLDMIRIGGSGGAAPVNGTVNGGSWGAVIAAYLGFA